MSSGPVLALRDVTVRRRGVAVLRDVSLEVAPGTLHALVGPNGSGKSTLFGVVLGAVDFTGSAELRVASGARAVGYVPQALGDVEKLPLTVAELLALQRQRWPVCLGVRASTRSQVARALERVGLAGFGGRRIDRLSGGERQRVLWANAIDPAPALLLLDEPMTALDAASRARLEALIQEVRAAGAAVLMASHDAEQVARLADSVTRLGPSLAGPASEVA